MYALCFVDECQLTTIVSTSEEYLEGVARNRELTYYSIIKS